MFEDFQWKKLENEGHTLPYRFYEPPHLEPGKIYPLVLLMHGAGERGNDNRHQLMNFEGIAFWQKYPCFVLAPQCPLHEPDRPDDHCVWVATSFGGPAHTMKVEPTWPMKLTLELLEKSTSEYPVDFKRIYLTGLSMGAFAAWELLQRVREKFAAAIPVCGGADLKNASELVNFPLWVFHGDADQIVLAQRSRDMVAAIKAKGGHPKYTEYPGLGHDIYKTTYTNPEVWDWLFAQSKK